MVRNQRADTPGLVELQLLRHGSPHNQLLSPLTDYLALCGDHPNTTLRIPLEHAALETRLRALRYFDSEETRIDQLRETSRIASELFSKVPGLIAELSADHGSGAPFVHMSIVSRASELALFPFELAVSPDGFPGAGQTLTMQRQLPISLTRRSRNIRNDDFVWDRPIKILLVASDAGGPVPISQHYALLRKLVEPWVGRIDGQTAGSNEKIVDSPGQMWIDPIAMRRRDNLLTLLTDASVYSIASALSLEVDNTGEPFTHIHILAHGCDLPDTDRRSGVALHHPTRPGEIDAVDGRRLAQTLGCLPDFPEEANRYQGPAVVTMATCSSADQSSVKISGASLAFDLHDSGIPLVVGSQFPLTTDGSIIMTEALYEGFLAGGDPRSTVWEARRALLTNIPQRPKMSDQLTPSSHDWASMTVYAALPSNLDQVLPSHWSKRNQQRLDVRLENIHRLSRSLGLNIDPSLPQNPWRRAADDAIREADIFSRWTETLEGIDETTRVGNAGILASAQKQIGLILINAAYNPSLIHKFNSEEEESPIAMAITKSKSKSLIDAFKRWLANEVAQKPDILEKHLDLLNDGEKWVRRSRSEYRRIFDTSRSKTWALVQYLALDFALRGDFNASEWDMAQQLAIIDEHTLPITQPAGVATSRNGVMEMILQDRARGIAIRVDALSARVELYFIKALRTALVSNQIDWHSDIKLLVDQLLRMSEERNESRNLIRSPIRQWQRYARFAECAYFAMEYPDRSNRLMQVWNKLLFSMETENRTSLPHNLSQPHLLSGAVGDVLNKINEVLKQFQDIDNS